MTAELSGLKVGTAELVECASVGMVIKNTEDGNEHRIIQFYSYFYILHIVIYIDLAV